MAREQAALVLKQMERDIGKTTYSNVADERKGYTMNTAYDEAIYDAIQRGSLIDPDGLTDANIEYVLSAATNEQLLKELARRLNKDES